MVTEYSYFPKMRFFHFHVLLRLVTDIAFRHSFRKLPTFDSGRIQNARSRETQNIDLSNNITNQNAWITYTNIHQLSENLCGRFKIASYFYILILVILAIVIVIVIVKAIYLRLAALSK